MKNALIKMGFNEEIKVDYGSFDFDVKKYKLTLFGTKGNVADFSFNTTLLEYNETQVAPTLTEEEIRAGNDNTFFDPIPPEMLFTHETTP